MLLGLAINAIGLNPVRMLVVAAVVNGVVAPPLIAVLALLARKQEVMGEYRSGGLSTMLMWLAFAGMSAAALGLAISAVAGSGRPGHLNRVSKAARSGSRRRGTEGMYRRR